MRMLGIPIFLEIFSDARKQRADEAFSLRSKVGAAGGSKAVRHPWKGA